RPFESGRGRMRQDVFAGWTRIIWHRFTAIHRKGSQPGVLVEIDFGRRTIQRDGQEAQIAATEDQFPGLMPDVNGPRCAPLIAVVVGGSERKCGRTRFGAFAGYAVSGPGWPRMLIIIERHTGLAAPEMDRHAVMVEGRER